MNEKMGRRLRSGSAVMLAVVVSLAMLWTPLLAKDVSAASRPAAPVVTALANSNSSIVVKWKKVSKAKGYRIYRATKKNGTYKKVKTITKGSTTSWKSTKLTAGKTYYYKMKAYKYSGGKTIWSYAGISDHAKATSALYYEAKFVLNADAAAQSSIAFTLYNKCTKTIVTTGSGSFISDTSAHDPQKISCYANEDGFSPGETRTLTYSFQEPESMSDKTVTADFTYERSELCILYTLSGYDSEGELYIKNPSR